jgi:hypothetical protein
VVVPTLTLDVPTLTKSSTYSKERTVTQQSGHPGSVRGTSRHPRDLGPEGGLLFGVLEEIQYLLQLEFCLVGAGRPQSCAPPGLAPLTAPRKAGTCCSTSYHWALATVRMSAQKEVNPIVDVSNFYRPRYASSAAYSSSTSMATDWRIFWMSSLLTQSQGSYKWCPSHSRSPAFPPLPRVHRVEDHADEIIYTWFLAFIGDWRCMTKNIL